MAQPAEIAPKLVLYFDIEDATMFESSIPIGSYLNLLLSKMCWGTIDPKKQEWVIVSDIPSIFPPHEDDSLITYYEFVMRGAELRKGSRDEEREWTAQREASLHNFTAKGQPGFVVKASFDQWVKNLSLPMPVRKAFEVEKPDLQARLPCSVARLVESEGRAVAQKAEYTSIAAANFDLLGSSGFYRVSPAVWQLIMHLTREREPFRVVLLARDAALLPSEAHEQRLAEFLAEWELFARTMHAAFNGSNRTKPAKLSGEKGTSDLRIIPELTIDPLASSGHLPEEVSHHLSDAGTRLAEITFSPASEGFHVEMKANKLAARKLPVEGTAGVLVDPAVSNPELEAAVTSGPVKEQGADAKGLLRNATVQGSAEVYVSIMRRLLSAEDNSAALLIQKPSEEETETLEDKEKSEAQLQAERLSRGIPAPVVLVDPNDKAFHTVLFQSERSKPAVLLSAESGVQLDAKFTPEVVYAVADWQLAANPEVLIDAVKTMRANRARREKKDREQSSEAAPVAPARSQDDPLGLKGLDGKAYLLETVLPALLPAVEECLRERPRDPLTTIAFRLLESMGQG